MGPRDVTALTTAHAWDQVELIRVIAEYTSCESRHATHLLQLARVRLGNMTRQLDGIAGIIANMTS